MRHYLSSFLSTALGGGIVASLSMSITSCSQNLDVVEPAIEQKAVAMDTHSVTLSMPGDIKSDRDALESVYKALGGEEWIDQAGWLSNAPLDEWYGVKVSETARGPRVTELRLFHNNLQGSLPVEIGKLDGLKVLDLGYNTGLNGGIPEELYLLKNLEVLKLRKTSVTGRLSASIKNLAKIDTLDFNTSKWNIESAPYNDTDFWAPNKAVMTGEIPAEIGYLSQARYIDLSHQGFSGALPAEIGLLETADYIDLSHNNLTGELPATLGRLKELRTLFLGHNDLTGSIPKEIGDMESLEELYLNNNNLSGTIPNEVGNLKNLMQLSFEYNQLSGSIPTTLTQMPRIMTIRLGSNHLTGIIPVGFGDGVQKGNLIRVSLFDNDLEGTVPARIRQSADTEREGFAIFELSGNRLSGEVPAEYLRYPETLHYLIPQQVGYGFINL